MEMTVPPGFDGVPADEQGRPILVARSEEDYRAYIAWLADFLYRPDLANCINDEVPGTSPSLMSIEIDIADILWRNPYDDYPPPETIPPSGAMHADIFHRAAMSRILSRVHDRPTRIRLIDDFYSELYLDARK